MHITEPTKVGQSYIVLDIMPPKGAILIIDYDNDNAETVKVWRRNFKKNRCYVRLSSQE